MKLIFFAIILTILLRLYAARYVDSVIPAPLRELNNGGNNGNWTEALIKSLQVLTVTNLMNQGWQLYDEDWYKLFEVELMWIPAENFCRQLGGHLVSIRDAAENDFVHKLRKKNNIWIGLNKLMGDRTYYGWSDGKAAGYLNWDSTQPNEPNVHCVYMAYNQEQRGTWFDYACHQKLPQYFMCKLKL